MYMKDNFSYNGVVTLATRINNKVVSKKYYNSGDEHLFEAYARALSGQPIYSFIPSTIDIGKLNGTTFKSVLRNTHPVIVNYKEKSSEDTSYGVPYTRVSIILTKNMFESLESSDVLTLNLKAADGGTLATLKTDTGFTSTIQNLAQGTQLILLWDLYVKNGGAK